MADPPFPPQGFARNRRIGLRALRRAGRHGLSNQIAEWNLIQAYKQIVNDVGSQQDRIELLADIVMCLRTVLLPQSKFNEIKDYIDALDSHLQNQDSSRLRALVSGYSGNLKWRQGDGRGAIAEIEEGLNYSDEVGDLSLDVWLNFQLCLMHNSQGNFKESINCGKKVIDATSGGDLELEDFGTVGHPSVICRWALAWSHAELGNFTEGAAQADRAIEIAGRTNHSFDETVAHFARGIVHLYQGSLSSAIASLEHSLSICQEENIEVRYPTTAAALGYAKALDGHARNDMHQLDAGLALLGKSKTTAEGKLNSNSDRQPYHALRLAWLYEAMLLKRVQVSREKIEYVGQLAKEQNERGSLAWATRLFGQFSLLQENDYHLAKGMFEEARNLAVSGLRKKDMPMKPLEAHCRLGIARCSAKLNVRESARVEMNRALELYETLEMPFWYVQAEKQSNESKNSY